MTNGYEVLDVFRIKDLLNQRLSFKVPLNYFDNGDSREITVVANLTQTYKKELHSDSQKLAQEAILPKESRVICYVQGGPGFPCGAPLSKSSYTQVLLEKGYQILYLDQRGTGYSTPLDGETFETLVPAEEGETEEEHTDRQLKYILNFRADSIVEDLESIRKILLGKDGKFSLLGQSFGGFCSFTYMSKHPESLREVAVTGGVPPINRIADDVYTATYERTKERNVHYYDKYPQDIAKVKNILKYLYSHKVVLPDGGNLSVERFQQLGIMFGFQGGTDDLHQLVLKFDFDLTLLGKPTYTTLSTIQASYSFDTNILYALFQEAIYCDGNNKTSAQASTNWSADRLRYSSSNAQFVYSEEMVNSEKPIYLTGEMVYKSMFDDYSVLRKFKKLAFALHSYEDWSSLYDVPVLSSLSWEKLPIVSATYVYDQYVDFNVTMKVKEEVFKGNGNLKQYITSEFFHNGIRADSEKVLGSLLSLIENGEID